MNKKNIKKIIIPLIAIIVIIGGLVSYFVKPQEVQPVMAPLDTQQDLVEEKEEIPEEPQEDIATDNKEEEIATETEETVETEEAVEDTESTDTTLSEDEYQGDEETDAANMEFTDEEMELIKKYEAEIIAEHPEWFTDTNPSTPSDGNYEHVGTPSTGELPTYTIGESGSEGLSTGVTVY